MFYLFYVTAFYSVPLCRCQPGLSVLTELKPTFSKSHHEFLTMKSYPINSIETSKIQYGV